MDKIHIGLHWSEAETVRTHILVVLPELFIWHVICNVLWSTYLCISGSYLSEFSFSHVEVTTVCLCCGSQFQWFPAGGGLSLHGCRRDVLLDLCCDLFAPGLNIWLSPQAPSACLGLYVGLSIEHWGPITLQGPVRTVGFSLMTYSQKHISGHAAPLFLDFQSQACLIWLLHAQSWQYQPLLCEIAYHQSSNDRNTIRQNLCFLSIYF